MKQSAKELLIELLETPSPSGSEQPVQEIVRRYLGEFADEVRTDRHGNVIGCCNPGKPLRVLLAGHCDQIGLLISYIDENGFLRVQTIGGWDPQQLIGQRMVVWTKSGAVPGVIARKAIHLLTAEERKKVTESKELWIDIGAASRDEAKEVVRIGDPVTLELGYRELRGKFATAPKMDNTTGLWTVLEALRRASEMGLNCSLYAASTVQEEIGLRGARTSAFGVDPQMGIAVDVTHATDCPTVSPDTEGEVKLGGGPVIFRGPNMSPIVSEALIETAEEHEIEHQLAAIGRATPNDANVLQINRDGVATGLVSIPNRYMHSAVEMIHLDDIDRAAELIARYVGSLSGDEDFIP
ncbi:MAG: M42 family peptidase [Acidobacteria bacterium]|nr:MAG: M42 family peptidase [Acidobacteriota bacterium]REK11340.1 MAG: M42 family peptidase [Acidobacteriota bacterium]